MVKPSKIRGESYFSNNDEQHVSKEVFGVHRQAKFAQSTILCFRYLGFLDHTFTRAKLANYVISPGQNFRVPDSTTSNKIACLCTVIGQGF